MEVNMWEIILLVIVIISFILLIGTIFNNKYNLAIIKIDKAEEDINIYLEKKEDLLDRTRPIIKKELKLKSFLDKIDEKNDNISNFQKNDFLKNIYNELFKILDENEKLLKSEALNSILKSLNDNEEQIVGAIKFYNDTVVDYNKLIISFPTNIIAFFKGYKKKEFYNNEKREMFEILNEK